MMKGSTPTFLNLLGFCFRNAKFRGAYPFVDRRFFSITLCRDRRDMLDEEEGLVSNSCIWGKVEVLMT